MTSRPDPVARAKELQDLCSHVRDRRRELVGVGRAATQRRHQLREQRRELYGQMGARRSLLYTDASRTAAAILEACFQVSGMSLIDLWLEYFALAGNLTPDELEKVLVGQAPLYREDQNRLSCILS